MNGSPRVVMIDANARLGSEGCVAVGTLKGRHGARLAPRQGRAHLHTGYTRAVRNLRRREASAQDGSSNFVAHELGAGHCQNNFVCSPPAPSFSLRARGGVARSM